MYSSTADRNKINHKNLGGGGDQSYLKEGREEVGDEATKQRREGMDQGIFAFFGDDDNKRSVEKALAVSSPLGTLI